MLSSVGFCRALEIDFELQIVLLIMKRTYINYRHNLQRLRTTSYISTRNVNNDYVYPVQNFLFTFYGVATHNA